MHCVLFRSDMNINLPIARQGKWKMSTPDICETLVPRLLQMIHFVLVAIDNLVDIF